MSEFNDQVEEIVDKMFDSFLRNSEESIRRAARTLLLANAGGLALSLNLLDFSHTEFGSLPTIFLYPLVAFTVGVLSGGYGHVSEGILFAIIRAMRNNQELMSGSKKVIVERIVKKSNNRSQPIEGVDLDNLVPEDKVRRGSIPTLLSLFISIACLFVGVVSAFVIAF